MWSVPGVPSYIRVIHYYYRAVFCDHLTYRTLIVRYISIVAPALKLKKKKAPIRLQLVEWSECESASGRETTKVCVRTYSVTVLEDFSRLKASWYFRLSTSFFIWGRSISSMAAAWKNLLRHNKIWKTEPQRGFGLCSSKMKSVHCLQAATFRPVV